MSEATKSKKQLEVGKEYVTRNGERVKCVHIESTWLNRALILRSKSSEDCVAYYTTSFDGRYSPNFVNEWDIVFPKVTCVRPWRSEEVPLGAEIRHIDHGQKTRLLILQVWEYDGEVRVKAGTNSFTAVELALPKYTLKDGSRCGIIEEVGE